MEFRPVVFLTAALLGAGLFASAQNQAYVATYDPATSAPIFGTVDLDTGQFKQIKSPQAQPYLAGLAGLNGVLYGLGSPGASGGSVIYQIDQSNGVQTPIGTAGVVLTGWFGSTKAGVFAMGQAQNAPLYSISTTNGSATLVGLTGIDNRYNSSSDSGTTTGGLSTGDQSLYLMASHGSSLTSGFYSVNTTTGMATLINTISAGVCMKGMTAAQGKLYAGSGYCTAGSNIYNIDRTTGTSTLVKTVSGYSDFNGMVAAPTLSVPSTPLAFNYVIGGATPPSQLVAISGSTGIVYTAAAGGATWLSATGGAVLSNTTVSVNPSGLTAGVYKGTITVTSAGAIGSPATVPVTLTVIQPNITATSSLSFSYQINGKAPAPQTIQIGGTSGLAFAAAVTSSAPWLSLSATSGTVPGSINASINTAGLNVGTFTAAVAISASNAKTQNVAVSLTVSAPPTISVNPSTLTFSYQAGSTNPLSQSISLSGSVPGIAFSITSNQPWLTASSSSGSTPGSAAVSVNPASLAPGVYYGNLAIASAGANTVTIPVTLVVSNGIDPVINGITDGAAYKVDGFAPGSIISIFGDRMGPDPYVAFGLNQADSVDSSLAGVTVTVDGAAAIPLLSWVQQINAIIPFGAKTSGMADVFVTYNGGKSRAFQIPMAPAAVKLFAANAAGSGPAAALNQDYSVNTADHPADKGSVVQLFGTGGGVLTPAVVEGGVGGNTLSWVALPYSASVDGVDAKVTYAGDAPGLVFGVNQFNIQLPADVASGRASIVVKVGASQTQPGITVYVK